MEHRYETITRDMLGTKRQRPMYLSKFTEFRKSMDMRTYPVDPHAYKQEFLTTIDGWIRSHNMVGYLNLDSLPRRDAILGTTHQLDELHMLHGSNICTFKGEYKYHRRLTDFNVKQVTSFKQISKGDVLVVSYPSCITTGQIDGFDDVLDHCLASGVPVHIDGAWFGQCRNAFLDVSHPAIESLSVSLSKAFGMGSQRIGIRYMRRHVNGPIAIMNDFDYANVSDMWIGTSMIRSFGSDYWWKNYGQLYKKVCDDLELEEADSIHVAWGNVDGYRCQLGVRTPLRMLIEGVYDERGTDAGLNQIERNERR